MTDPVPATGATADAASAAFLRYARDRDRAVLDALLVEHADRAFAHARRLLGNDADAEDAVQEAWLQLVRTASRFDGRVPFAAWLHRAIHVAAVRQRRADRRRRRRESAAAPIAVATAPAADDDAERVRRAVAELPSAYRAALDLHYFAGLSQSATADALGISANALGVRLHRGRERLRRRLARHGCALAAADLGRALAATPAQAAPASLRALDATSLLARAAAPGALTAAPLALIVAVLVAAVATVVGVALRRVDATPSPQPPPPPLADAPAPAPPAATSTAWTGRARALLRWLPGDAVLRLGCDLDSARAQALATEPTALLADPAVAPVVARVAAEIARYQRFEDGPPIAPFLPQGHGFVLAGGGVGDGRWPEPMAMIDFGAAGPAMAAFLARDRPGAPVAAGPFTGSIDRGDILAFAGDVLASGSREMIDRAVAADGSSAIDAEALAAPVWTVLRLQPLLSAEAVAADARLIATVAPRGGAWGSRLRATGLSPLVRPLAPVDRALIAASPGDALASLAANLRWDVVLPPLLAAMHASDAADDAAALLRQCTGDVAVVVDENGLLAHVAIALVLRDDAGPAAIDALLARVAARPRPGRADRWTVPSPLGVVTIARAGRMLVAGTRPDRVEALAALGPSGARGDEAMVARIDLPRVARRWLPLVSSFVPKLRVLAERLPQALRNVRIAASWRAADAGAVASLADALTRAEASAWTAEALRPLLGDAPIDAAFAVYGPDPALASPQRLQSSSSTFHSRLGTDQDGDGVVAVWRSADGWRLVDRTQDGLDAPSLDASALTARLAGLRRLAGPAPEQLRALAVPVLPTLDRGWLPDPEAVARHLRPYALRVTVGDDIVAEEDGLPLLGLLSWIAPLATVQTESALATPPPEASAPTF